MPVPDWTTSQDWDVLYLGAEVVPGVARVSARLPTALDKQKPQGSRKGRVKDLGVQPLEFRIDIEMLPAELDYFDQAIVPLLQRRNQSALREPITIGHPQARLWDVSQVMIGDVRVGPPDSGGSITVSIEAVEYREPKPQKKVAKPVQQQGDEGWNVDDEIDAQRPAAAGAPAQNFSDPDQLFTPGP